MCPKRYGLFRKLLILMTTQLANGVRYVRRRKILERVRLKCFRQKWLSARAAEQLQAARRCNRLASCRYATSGTAPYDGSACPAYARTRLPLLAPVGAAATTYPCRGSNGSDLPASAALHHLKWAPPTTSTDDQR